MTESQKISELQKMCELHRANLAYLAAEKRLTLKQADNQADGVMTVVLMLEKQAKDNKQ